MQPSEEAHDKTPRKCEPQLSRVSAVWLIFRTTLSSLHFDEAVNHEVEESGEQGINDVWLFDKLDLDRQMPAFRARPLMTMHVMVFAKAGLRPQNRCTGYTAREKQREDLLVNEAPCRARIFIQINGNFSLLTPGFNIRRVLWFRSYRLRELFRCSTPTRKPTGKFGKTGYRTPQSPWKNPPCCLSCSDSFLTNE